MTGIDSPLRRRSKAKWLLAHMRKRWQLYLLVLPTLVWYIIFCYGPMYGVIIAFKDYSARKGIWFSPLTSDYGFGHFIRFFNSYYFWVLIRNTVVISLYNLAIGFPLPILLALCLNEIKNGFFKNLVQTTTYAPYFISTVVMCGMLITFLSPTSGIVNKFIERCGGEAIPFMSKAGYFPTIYVLSNVWQGTGWGSIIYLASLSGVDEQLHEAATIDGATRLQRLWHINIPYIVPTMVILLILNSGSILSVGYEKVYLLQNELNTDTSEVISTYVYKTGLVNAQYSFSTAVGLFNSVINLIILVAVNTISGRVSENSLW
jgi:putative aldouronate transport system permease protein